MERAFVSAGLLHDGQVVELLGARTQEVKDAYLATLDETERVRAEDFLAKASEAAAEQWRRIRNPTWNSEGVWVCF